MRTGNTTQATGHRRLRRALAWAVTAATFGTLFACSAEEEQGSADRERVTLRTSSGDEVSARISRVTLPTDELPNGFTAAGRGVEVEVVDGAATELLELSVPGAAPPHGATAVMLHRTDALTWEFDAATFEAGIYTASVGSFSLRIPGWLTDGIDSISDWVTGRTDPPTDCETDPYGWVAAGSPPADGSFHACVRANPDSNGGERVEVKIKSNRAMAMWITIPEFDYDYLWIEGSGDWAQLGTLIEELDVAFGPDRVLLPPGRTMTLGYRRPVGSGPQLEFSSYQNITTQLASLAHKYLGDAGTIGMAAVLLLCLDAATLDGVDRRFANLGSLDAAECFLDAIGRLVTDSVNDGVGSLLQQRYDAMVREGRFKLSAGASDGIVPLIQKASKIKYAAAAALNALTAVTLLGDATSMVQDGLVGLWPGLNTYTVFVIGAADTPPTHLPTRPTTPDLGALASVTIPSLCGHEGGTLIDGRLPVPPGPNGQDLGDVHLLASSAVFGDISGDAVPEVAAVFGCSQGGVGWPEQVVVFDSGLNVIGVVDTGDASLMAVDYVWRTGVGLRSEPGRFVAEVSIEKTAVEPTTNRTVAITLSASGLQTSILPAVALATCISGELWLGIDGHRPEVALYQLTLAQRGYDPGDIDGYFGPRTQ